MSNPKQHRSPTLSRIPDDRSRSLFAGKCPDRQACRRIETRSDELAAPRRLEPSLASLLHQRMLEEETYHFPSCIGW